jgi:23S rRNA (adenine2503-C2)-methyltransferase
MPIANKYSISDIVKAVKYYFEKTGRRIIFEYTMIKEINMNFFDCKRLKEITAGYPSHVNLIPLNYVKEKGIKGCTKQEADRFCERLNSMGVSATIRKSKGSDIGGACGQLRRKYIGEAE